MKWEEIENYLGYTSNLLLRGEGFNVSYNLAPGQGGVFGRLFISDGDGPETALIKDEVFYILNGDFRDQYEKLVPQGWDACKQFYDQQSPQHASSWGTERKMSS